MNAKYFSRSVELQGSFSLVHVWCWSLCLQPSLVNRGHVADCQRKDVHLKHRLSIGLCWVLYCKCSLCPFNLFETLKQTEVAWEKKKRNWMKQQKPPKVLLFFFRLDFSVVELLDIFSPVSAPEQCKPSTRRPKTSQHRPALTTPKPVCRPLLTPAGSYLQSTRQDLEESQILEDIFFICWQRRKWITKERKQQSSSHLIFTGLVLTLSISYI